jgi:GTP:adenosylcobinamide-phosphate guanylyltransferase
METSVQRYQDLATPLAAIIGAGGGYAPDDPLLCHAGVGHKALIPISGAPMILHVAQALADSGYIGHLILVGLDPGHKLDFPLPTTYLAATGGIVETFVAGAKALERIYPGAERVLLCSTDIPLITGEMIRYLVDTALGTGADVCYTVVPRETMEARFPNSGRSYARLRDGAFAGGDVHLINPRVLWSNRRLMEEIVGARKNNLMQARMIGFGFLLRFLFRRLTLAQGERKAESMIGFPCRIIPVRYAELGMDVDKPEQLDVIRAEVARRAL